ncbi:hypothetical protein CVT25_012281 [Psilocybe cyanescens]|uniref:Uncharacterized protein n=1 Tax=Psilocybe cyanescens TaxID=93625 RepID=A0A409XH85_PSICY|nr:hypothetical protein CVT25_012281 [Psilocybe cyanescens]
MYDTGHGDWELFLNNFTEGGLGRLSEGSVAQMLREFCAQERSWRCVLGPFSKTPSPPSPATCPSPPASPPPPRPWAASAAPFSASPLCPNHHQQQHQRCTPTPQCASPPSSLSLPHPLRRASPLQSPYPRLCLCRLRRHWGSCGMQSVLRRRCLCIYLLCVHGRLLSLIAPKTTADAGTGVGGKAQRKLAPKKSKLGILSMGNVNGTVHERKRAQRQAVRDKGETAQWPSRKYGASVCGWGCQDWAGTGARVITTIVDQLLPPRLPPARTANTTTHTISNCTHTRTCQNHSQTLTAPSASHPNTPS